MMIPLHRRFFVNAMFPLALVGCLLAQGCQPAQPASKSELMPDQPIRALAYRFSQRLSSDGTVPKGALSRALLQREELLRRRPLHAGVFPASWTWLGPGNVGGRVRPIVIHPTNPSIMWTGAVTGGVWKTLDGGASWLPLEDFLPAINIGCMAMHPSEPDTLYIGTGEGFAEWPAGTTNTAFLTGLGMYRSTDGGQNWEHLPNTSGTDFEFINRIAISPENPDVLLIATGTGVFRSTNRGANWTKVYTGFAYDVKFHPTDGTKAMAGLHDDGAAYSTNGGQTWTLASGISGHRTELCYSISNPSTVFAAVSENDRILIYRSTNGGQSFTRRTSGSGISTYSAYNNTLWVDPTNPNTLIVGGVYLYRSTDAGVTLNRTFTSVHADMHGIVHHPGFNGSTNRTVYFATDGGVYRTTDSNGSSATALNNNLGITQFYGAVMNPTTGVIVGGTQDNGTKRFNGNPQGWTNTFGGDGGHTAYDPTNSNYFYGEIQWGAIFRSTNGGSSASYIYNSSNPITDAGTSTTNFITHFVVDPNNPNRILVGCRRLWRTNNAKASTTSAVSWEIIKPTIEPLRPEPPNAHFLGSNPYNISTVAIDPSNSDRVYVGYNNGQVWKSANATATSPSWQRVDDAGGPMPERWVSRICLDPNDPNRVFVAFMGWESDNVWQSLDDGATWQSASGSGLVRLPEAPVSALAVHPTEPGWLYAGTDIGLFTSVDYGENWSTLQQGPATVPIDELHFVDSSRLLAVTHGRGIYVATIAPAVDPISPDILSVYFGILKQGGLPWLYLSDDKRVVVQADLDSADVRFPVDLGLLARCPYPSVSELRFRLEASATGLGLGQEIQFWNYSEWRFERVHVQAATTADSVVEVVVTNNPNRFIDPATRRMIARLSWAPDAFETAGTWSVRIDQAYWVAVR